MRLVYTGTDGALYVCERARAVTRLTWPWEEVVAGARVGLSYEWPTCSRDGRRVLALAHRGDDRHFLYVVDASGVIAEEIAALGDAPRVYHRVVSLDLQNERERAIPRPTIACCWHPERPQLFRLAVDHTRDALSWEYEEGDEPPTTIVRFVPTREIVFAASFFDQYATSHAAIAPDGTMLAVAGRLHGGAGSSVPRVYTVGIADGDATAVGDGVSAVWAP